MNVSAISESQATAATRWHLKQNYQELHVHGRAGATVKLLGVNLSN